MILMDREMGIKQININEHMLCACVCYVYSVYLYIIMHVNMMQMYLFPTLSTERMWEKQTSIIMSISGAECWLLNTDLHKKG